MLNAIFSDAPGDHDPLPREEWTFAGVIGIINASVNDMGAEPGHIQILKGFQVSPTPPARKRRIMTRISKDS